MKRQLSPDGGVDLTSITCVYACGTALKLHREDLEALGLSEAKQKVMEETGLPGPPSPSQHTCH